MWNTWMYKPHNAGPEARLFILHAPGAICFPIFQHDPSSQYVSGYRGTWLGISWVHRFPEARNDACLPFMNCTQIF